MNYPSDKTKEPKRKLYYAHRYLVYDVGYGEQGAEERYSIYRYYICEGRTEEEAVNDWIRQSPFSEVWLVDGTYHTERSWLRIVPLVSGSDEKEEHYLKWV